MFDTVNPELLSICRQSLREKHAFVPAQDPSAAGGGAPPGGGAAPGGGAPPQDPMAMMGGAPPADPMGGGEGGGSNTEMMLQQILQQLRMGGGAGGQAGAGGPLKPKIDVNVALMQISKMLARIADSLGVQIPAHEMIATPQDLGAMASQQQTGAPGSAPAGGAGGAGGAGVAGGAIPPIDPVQGMQSAMGGEKISSANGRHNNGEAFDTAGLASTYNRAKAVLLVRQRAQKNAQSSPLFDKAAHSDNR